MRERVKQIVCLLSRGSFTRRLRRPVAKLAVGNGAEGFQRQNGWCASSRPSLHMERGIAREVPEHPSWTSTPAFC
jgi:hypothetical protein